MPLVEKNDTFRKTILMGLSFFLHFLLLLILSLSDLGMSVQEIKKEAKLRIIKVANLIPKASAKKTAKSKDRPKPRKKTAEKQKTPKKTTTTKKSAEKAARLTKSQKVKTTKIKKAQTKVKKAKMKVVKKIRMQQEKRTAKKQAKAKTSPTKKQVAPKKVSVLKHRKTAKVVQKKKSYTKTHKAPAVRKIQPKVIKIVKRRKTKKQKTQKLKKTVKKITRKNAIKPRKSTKVLPTKKLVKKKTVKKQAKPAKKFTPVKKTLDVKKKKVVKIKRKIPKRKIKATKRTITKRKITPQKTAPKFKTQKTKKKRVQKLTRVRQTFKSNRRTITKPRKTPKITQSQKTLKKQTVRKTVSTQVKTHKPKRKKLLSKKKTATPKGIEHVRVTKKYKSLLAVEKTKSAPTITTVSMQNIEPAKPKFVKEVGRVSRRQAVKLVPTPSKTPLLKEKPVLDSAPSVKQTKQIQKAQSTPVTDKHEPVKKELSYTKAIITPTKTTKMAEEKVKYQMTKKVASERNIQTSTPVLETDIPVTEAPQVVATEAVTRKSAVPDIPPSSVVPVQAPPTLNSTPATEQQVKQVLVAAATTRATDQPIVKDLDFEMERSAAASVALPTKKTVTYENKASTTISEKNIQTDAPVLETDIPVAEAPQVVATEAVARKSAVSNTAAPSSMVPVTTEAPALDSTPATEQQVKQTLVAEASARSTDQPVEKAIDFQVKKSAAASVALPTQKTVTYDNQATTSVSERSTPGPSDDLAPMEEFSPEKQAAVESSLSTSARSATQVQSAFSEQVPDTAKAALSGSEDLPTSDQSKEFTQASIATQTGEEGDIEGKTIQTERLTDGTAGVTELASRSSKSYDLSGLDSTAAPTERSTAGFGKGGPKITVKRPVGNMTNDPLYHMTGSIDGDAKGAFITVNGNTQIAAVLDGQFSAELALVKGINEISVLAFDSGGGIGRRKFKLLFSPPKGVPTVILENPENGRQGAKAGDPVMVEGTIDDNSISRAKLLLNGIPIPLKVINGRFRRKIFLPRTRVTTFRIMATGRNGQTGYSSLHTVLIGYDIDIRNPRPY